MEQPVEPALTDHTPPSADSSAALISTLSNRRAINFRSLVLGSALVVLLAGLGPYNDFVVSNGFLIACYLPVLYVLSMFALVVFFNAPLRRWWPTQALSGGEMGIAALMLLVGCSIPCQGLLRSFLPELVHPFYHGQFDNQFWQAFTAMGLPKWLFPVGDINAGRTSSVMTWFYTKVPDGEPIPYAAWIRPLMGWGVFFVSMFATLVSAAMLLYPQWAVNERLAFPIAQVELALISEPDRNRFFGAIYRSRLFWIGAGIAFLLQNQVALNIYFPKQMPKIPMNFDLTNVLTAEPWVYLSPSIKKNAIIFLYLAMGYFVQGRVGFSVWASYLILQSVKLMQQMWMQQDMPEGAMLDQHLGASLVFIAGVFWVGRHHWKKTLTDTNSRSRLLLGILLLGMIGMMMWLWFVGVSFGMSLLIVGFILLAHIVTARIVAETGIPVFRSYATPEQFYTRMNPSLFTGRDVYFTQFFTCVGSAFTSRESVMAFVQHALWVFKRSSPQPTKLLPKKVFSPRIGPVIAWAMILSFFVGTWSSLHCYYTYPRPLSRHVQQQFINPRGQEDLPTKTIVGPLIQFSHGRFIPSAWHPASQMSCGAGITAILVLLALRSPSWPLLPVGYLLATTPVISWCWFSIMLGWLAKVLALRFGGAKMYQDGKNLFTGLIVGEALAAAVWIGINMVLAGLHQDYHPITFYPS